MGLTRAIDQIKNKNANIHNCFVFVKLGPSLIWTTFVKIGS